MIADINPGSVGSAPTELVRIGDTLWFQATEGTEKELWVSQGFSGAEKIDVLPGSFGSSPKALADVGGTLYFAATSATAGQELFRVRRLRHRRRLRGRGRGEPGRPVPGLRPGGRPAGLERRRRRGELRRWRLLHQRRRVHRGRLRRSAAGLRRPGPLHRRRLRGGRLRVGAGGRVGRLRRR
ncbi:MAG: hypothetical protein H6744_13615 [Deltaproteobacteria bacterium]|nr:hypothetical protein [Deltaproteobacteria bacterium]